MKKKFVSGVVAALAFAGCMSAVPMTATSLAVTCETAVAVGTGQLLSRCPDTFRGGDRRGVTP